MMNSLTPILRPPVMQIQHNKIFISNDFMAFTIGVILLAAWWKIVAICQSILH